MDDIKVILLVSKLIAIIFISGAVGVLYGEAYGALTFGILLLAILLIYTAIIYLCKS